MRMINIENAKYSLNGAQLYGEILVGPHCPFMATG